MKTVMVIAGLIVAAIVGVMLYSSVPHLSVVTVLVDAKESQVLPHLTLGQSTRATSVYDMRRYTQGATESVSKATESNVKSVNEHLIQKEIKKLNLSGELHNIQKFSRLIHKASGLHSLKEKLQILPITCFPGIEGLFPPKYTKFLLALTEYATFHSKANNVRKLIWKCGPGDLCGGLVDRLRGIAFTLLLAVLSRRKLLLYWGMPNGEQIYLRPNAINWVPERSDVVDMAVYSAIDSAGAEFDRAVRKAIGQNNLTKVALKTNLELEFINNKPQWLIDGLKQTGLDTLSNRD